MFYLYFKFNNYRLYYSDGNNIVTGLLLLNGGCFKKENLLNQIKCIQTKNQWASLLKESNGFFAVVKCDEQNLWAAVDRIRSIPLFYGQKGNDFYISDSAEWIREKVGDTQIDSIAKEEFLLTGYMTGSDTLYPSVKQIQPGELIHVTKSVNGVKVNSYRYYQYRHNYLNKEFNEEELLRLHDEILIKIFEQLIKLANGRTLVIPLSGGYDSRLVALMLKRLGYDNIIAFSYGRPGNYESSISKKVAESLNIRWEFVPYTNRLWYKWFNSKERDSYYEFADGRTSIPHVQDWPAVWELKRRGCLPDDCIFVPGHSADLLAGSRSFSLPNLYDEKALLDEKLILESILEYHYSLFDWDKNNDLRFLFYNRILNVLEDIDIFPDNASAFESWDVAERQAKFIINSLRVYEFWGYSWWMPFWDKEYMDYWSCVPLYFRKNKRLYDKFVEDLCSKIIGQKNLTNRRKIMFGFFRKNKKNLKKLLRYLKLFRGYKYLQRLREYYYHPLACYGIINYREFCDIYTTKENINSILVKLYLRHHTCSVKP